MLLLLEYSSRKGFMRHLGNPRSVSRRKKHWCWTVIVLAIVGLTASLATRTFRLKVSSGTRAYSAASDGMRQHLDRDAVRWLPPVPLYVQLEAPRFYPRVAPAGPTLPGLNFEGSLYNRPPPSRS